ncbi:hypothetical protein ACFQZT_26135 [Paenibacillus sp. GCM10027628]|uniref:hypothetical protein n=1 Tax=Paenibacillus sp. GCM10027628 TaxID=3273413 RepID=UPI0036263F07
MVVEMDRKDWESFGDVELFMSCMEPTVLQVRGKDPAVKSQVISQLNSGQQALFMFRLLYPATNSAVDYYSWISYLLEQPNYWVGIIDGLRFFGDTSMIRLLEETAGILKARTNEISSEDKIELQAKITPLFEKFQNTVPDYLQQISSYIRSNPEEFVQFKN